MYDLIYEDKPLLMENMVKQGFDEEELKCALKSAISDKIPAIVYSSGKRAVINWTKTKRHTYKFIVTCEVTRN